MTDVDDKSTKFSLQTERVTLHRFTQGDVDNVFALDADLEVRRYLDRPLPPTREEVCEYALPSFMGWYERPGGFGYWAAEETASGAFLGWFHLRPSRENPREIELGYRLKKSAWGQGYATEGARALIQKGFTELNVARVTATALAANIASIRVMEKAGLRFVERFWYKPGMEAVKYGLDKRD